MYWYARQRRFRDLALAEKESDDPPAEQAAALLATEIIAGRCPLKNWDAAVEQWIARLNSLAVWMPELGLPPITSEDRRALLEQLCYGSTTYKAIKDRAVWPTIKSWLSPQQQEWIDTYVPERVELVTTRGPRKVKLTYSEIDPAAPPVLAARIQELYDVTGGLKVAAGRVSVTIQVLAPNHRPIQVTQDLANFLARKLPEAQAGTPTQVSPARVALRARWPSRPQTTKRPFRSATPIFASTPELNSQKNPSQSHR